MGAALPLLRVGDARCEGLPGDLGARTFLDTTVAGWMEGAAAEAGAPRVDSATARVLALPANAVASARALRAAASLAATRSDAFVAVPDHAIAARVAALTGPSPGIAAIDTSAAPDLAGLPIAPFDARTRRLDGLDLGGEPLVVADAYVLPVGHWMQLVWANLLALGPFLWSRLVGRGPMGALRLAGATVRAGSLRPEDVAARLNILGPGARIHRSAVVEGCVLGPGARIGAGAVVRGCVLGEEARVEEQALLEGAVIGRGAWVQRLGVVKFSVVDAEARMAGAIQLGFVGRGAQVKMGALFLDMAVGQQTRVRAGGELRAAPFGMCGVCVGDEAVVASGVRVAPGRVIPSGLQILPDPAGLLVRIDVPAGCMRARVRDGGLEPLA